MLSIHNNVLGTQEVLNFCANNEIPKVVFTSSSRVLSPEKNNYTAGKVFGEEALKGYSGVKDNCIDDFTILRPSTVYGPFNDLTKRLMDVWILNALTGKPLEIRGDKNKTLVPTYVDDFVDATLLAMGTKNREFNVYGADRQPVRVVELAEHIIRLNKGNGRIIYSPPEDAQPQEVGKDDSLFDAGLHGLGYAPKVNIREGTERCFAWYKKNLDVILATRTDRQ